jgi:magnesium transporter
MGYYEHEIARAVVLALFIPLIITSGGNSGSQASTLVVRALALGDVKLRNWWQVVYREFGMGLALGAVLGMMGFARISLWPAATRLYGQYYLSVAFAVSLSIVGIIMWGTLIGAVLPLLLRRLKLDPATACAPFVATIVDVSGLVIYFTVAQTVLKGTLL